MPPQRNLTKSLFRLAMECETKLFYTNKKNLYANKDLHDSFLESLAQGGFQVGELAKFYYCNDPVNANITIDTLDYNLAIAETEERLGENLWTEPAF